MLEALATEFKLLHARLALRFPQAAHPFAPPLHAPQTPEKPGHEQLATLANTGFVRAGTDVSYT